MSKIIIRKIKKTEILQLQEIGRKTFVQTFLPFNSQETIDEYLEESFAITKLEKELSNNYSEFYFAEINNNIVGYLKVNTGDAQTESNIENALEVERIYVLNQWHGKKVGQELLNKAITIAKNKKVERVWLGVWENNLRAVNFYEKNGFKRFGTHTFLMGSNKQIDLIMKTELNNEQVLKLQVSEDIQLKQIEISDAQDIFNTINTQRDYLGQWLPFVEHTKEVSFTEGFIKSLYEASPENRELIFVIKYKSEFAGIIGFKGTDKANKKTEIGYWLSEPMQKKGIVINSVKFLTNYAFEQLDINRIQIKCAVENHASKNIPQKLGYKLEGIERDGELLTGNVFTDIEVYSLLRKEIL